MKLKFLIYVLFVSFFMFGCENQNISFYDNLSEINNTSLNDALIIDDTSFESENNDTILSENRDNNLTQEIINENNEVDVTLEFENLEHLSDFQRKNPVSLFTEYDIEMLNIDCNKSTQEEIAQCIFDWQMENMVYTPTASDVSFNFPQPYPIRWNEYLPGIYGSRDIVLRQVLPDNRIFGICFDYAVLYCSIANYYGLDCRVMETMQNINSEPRAGGLSENEYDELKEFLDFEGLDYPYEAVRLAVPDDSKIAGHLWAEVKLNDEWIVFDASNPKYDGQQMTLDYKDSGQDYNVVIWEERDSTLQLENLTNMFYAGELEGLNTENNSDFQEFEEGREFYEDDLEAGRIEKYVGITDEFGNTNRAATIDDFMQGKALAPNIRDCDDMCEFIKAESRCLNDCKNEDLEYAECYDECSGDNLFLTCDYICSDEDDDDDWMACYKSCSGEDINLKCDYQCADD